MVLQLLPLKFVQGSETKIFSHHDAACELNKFDVTWVHPKIHGNLRGPPQEIAGLALIKRDY